MSDFNKAHTEMGEAWEEVSNAQSPEEKDQAFNRAVDAADRLSSEAEKISPALKLDQDAVLGALEHELEDANLEEEITASAKLALSPEEITAKRIAQRMEQMALSIQSIHPEKTQAEILANLKQIYDRHLNNLIDVAPISADENKLKQTALVKLETQIQKHFPYPA